MQTLDIYRYRRVVLNPDTSPFHVATIKPDDNSTQTKAIMGEDALRITFEDSKYIRFQIGDYCIFRGQLYTLFNLAEPTKNSRYRFEYSLTLHSEGYQLNHFQFLFLGSDNVFKQSAFPLNGRAEDFLDLVVQNANRAMGGWIKGQCVQTGYKDLNFSKQTCWQALQTLAAEFATEFWIEGRTIHLTRRVVDTPIMFQHGYGKGLYSMRRENVSTANLVTRLFVEGSERNLPIGYHGSTRLKMAGGQDFLENGVLLYGAREDVYVADDIYPHRTGTVTSVDATNFFTFNDADIDFNVLDYLLPGQKPKVVFNSGQLSGYEFEIANFDYGAKRFTLLQNQNEKTLSLPNQTLKPAMGDKYVLVDLYMPQQYLDQAEAELYNRANELLTLTLSVPQVAYSVECDPVFIRMRKLSLDIGQLCFIKDADLDISRKIRITSLVRNIVQEEKIQLTISDILPTDPIRALQTSQAANATAVQMVARQVGQLNRRLTA